MGKADILKAPSFLAEMGLDAMEYEAVRGVNIKEDKARKFGSEAKRHGIVLSLHAPYFINLASKKKDVIDASIRRLVDSLKAAEWMNAYIVVFHPGYYKDYGEKESVAKTIDALKKVLEKADRIGIRKPVLGPETTGKTSQVGSIEDVISICSALPRCKPTIDWAHIYARSLGKLVVSKDDVRKIIDIVEKNLGSDSIRPLHTHFSTIEYGKGGELRHHTLSEPYGPDWRMICSVYKELGIDAVIISESPVLEQDAVIMKKICQGEL
ncbi:MAG TPA: deoxyribonuclease IV [Desulfurococcaceae archaeon]|nr:deoxyribonuclease IV [Desulfurococcaceae archaeon]